MSSDKIATQNAALCNDVSLNSNEGEGTILGESHEDKYTLSSKIASMYSPKSASLFGLSNQTPKPPIKRESFVGTSYLPIHNYYKIGEKVGEGTWGAVYIVEERCSSIVRAAKKIPKQISGGDSFRFRQEMQLLSTLDHPNIARLYETFEDYNSIYLIMELCNGGELFDRLSQVYSFSERVAAHLIKQMLSAISYCHSKGIVHRDLKPENFLFLNSKSEISCRHHILSLKSNPVFKRTKDSTSNIAPALSCCNRVHDSENNQTQDHLLGRREKCPHFRTSRSLPSSLTYSQIAFIENRDHHSFGSNEYNTTLRPLTDTKINHPRGNDNYFKGDSPSFNGHENTSAEYCSCFELKSPLKLIDFGLAKRITKTGGYLRTRVGTLYYIAPEVLAGKGYDDKCDIWSIGVMTHILLSGVPPFTGNTDGEIIEKVKQGTISFSDPIWNNISKEAKDFLHKLLNKSPTDRISAFQALQHPWIRSWDVPSVPLCGIGMINKVIVWPWHHQRSKMNLKSRSSHPSLASQTQDSNEAEHTDCSDLFKHKNQTLNENSDCTLGMRPSNCGNSLLRKSCSTPLLYSMCNAYPNNNELNSNNLYGLQSANNYLNYDSQKKAATPRTKATISALLNQEDSITSPPCDPRFHFGCSCGNIAVASCSINGSGSHTSGREFECDEKSLISSSYSFSPNSGNLSSTGHACSSSFSNSSSLTSFTTSHSITRSSFSYCNLASHSSNGNMLEIRGLGVNSALGSAGCCIGAIGSSAKDYTSPNILSKVCNKRKLFQTILSNKACDVYKPLLRLFKLWERFCNYTLLKRVILVSIALRIGEKSHFNCLKEQFKKLDVAGDGVVSLAELQCVLCFIFHIESISNITKGLAKNDYYYGENNALYGKGERKSAENYTYGDKTKGKQNNDSVNYSEIPSSCSVEVFDHCSIFEDEPAKGVKVRTNLDEGKNGSELEVESKNFNTDDWNKNDEYIIASDASENEMISSDEDCRNNGSYNNGITEEEILVQLDNDYSAKLAENLKVNSNKDQNSCLFLQSQLQSSDNTLYCAESSISSCLDSFITRSSFKKDALFENMCVFSVEGIIKLNELCNKIENIFGIIDQDQSGSWEYTEFLAASMEPEMYLNNIKALKTVFRNFDRDSDGKVSVQDILASFGWEDDIILCSETISPGQYKQYLKIGNSRVCDPLDDNDCKNSPNDEDGLSKLIQCESVDNSVQYCAHIHWTEIFLNECCKPGKHYLDFEDFYDFLRK